MVDNLDNMMRAALLAQMLGGTSAPPPQVNPGMAALISMLGGSADAAPTKKKRRKSKFNRLVAKHMKAEGKRHPRTAAKSRFKRAVSLAKRELKRGQPKRKR